MNDLSWLLYLADTLPRLAGFAVFITFVFGILTMITSIVCWFAEDGDEDAQSFMRVPLMKHSLAVFVVSAFVSIAIPSKETFYMIAGSEAGEYVVNTPEARAILSDIQEVIQLQIEQLKPNDSPTTN